MQPPPSHLLACRLDAAQQLRKPLLAQRCRIRCLESSGTLGATPAAPPRCLACRRCGSSGRLGCGRLGGHRCCDMCRPLHLLSRPPIDALAVKRLRLLRLQPPVARALELVLLKLALQHRVASLGIPGAWHALGARALLVWAGGGSKLVCCWTSGQSTAPD